MRESYTKKLDSTISKIRKEFSEMDFENTDKHMAMQSLCDDAVRVCQKAKSRMNGMMFMAAEDYL